MINVKYYVKGRTGSRSGTYYASTHLADVSKEIQAFLKETAPGARGAAAEAAAKFLVGDGRHGLKHYPPYKYISRARAYGNVSKDGAPPGYFSWKQFRYVMWKRSKGEIDPGYPHRTGRLQRGWQMTRRGADVRIFNTQPHVLPVMGDIQSRHERQVGWRMVPDILETNIDGALLASKRAVIKYYKEKV
jgi:hypothetical protein